MWTMLPLLPGVHIPPDGGGSDTLFLLTLVVSRTTVGSTCTFYFLPDKVSFLYNLMYTIYD